MYARITTYKMKPGSRDAATGVMNGLKADILALPGMVRFINVMDDNGAGYIIALSKNETTDEATLAKIKALWGNFADLLEGPPERSDYDVIADWSS